MPHVMHYAMCPVMQVVESALGGVLFVDEAYAIVSDGRDQFGKEVRL